MGIRVQIMLHKDLVRAWMLVFSKFKMLDLNLQYGSNKRWAFRGNGPS